MPYNGYFMPNQNRNVTYGYLPQLTQEQRDYAQESPESLNQLMANQVKQGTASDFYRSWYNKWLDLQRKSYEGAVMQQPELQYADYLWSRKPEQDYEFSLQSLRPGTTRLGYFGPRLVRQ